jgi:hypothetical protein
MSKRTTSAANPEEAQPKRTADLRRESRLARIAKALAAGASITEIVETEGIGRTLASREANSAKCRRLIANFVDHERDEMHAMLYRAARAIEHALSARREYMNKTGEVVYGGPDYGARLAATKHLRDFLAAGQPATKQDLLPERTTFTLEEMEAAIAKARSPEPESGL